MTELISDLSPTQFLGAMRLAAEHAYEEKDPYSAEVLADTQKELSDTNIVVSVDNALVNGMIAYRMEGRQLATIYALAVAPEARGRKLGRALVEYVEEEAADQGAYEVELESRPTATEFYQHLGYTERPGRIFTKQL